MFWGSKADLRRRMRDRSECEEHPMLMRGPARPPETQSARLSVGGAKRRVVSPPAAEAELRILVPAWARCVVASAFAAGGSRGKWIVPPARATNAWAREAWWAI